MSSLISILKRKKEELSFEANIKNVKKTRISEEDIYKNKEKFQQQEQQQQSEYEIVISKNSIIDVNPDNLCNYYYPGSKISDLSLIKEILSMMNFMWGMPPHKKYNQNPCPQPRSATLTDIKNIDVSQYYVSEKIDGIRYSLMLIELPNYGPMAIMIDRHNRFYSIQISADKTYFEGTLFDGELAWQRDDEDSEKYMIWWGFDTVWFKGNSVSNEDYSTRLSYISQSFANLSDYPAYSTSDRNYRNKELTSMGKIICTNLNPELQLRPKIILMANKIEVIWKSIHQDQHLCDGLIFTPSDEKIQLGTDGKCYKWKWEHSIDLELRAKLIKQDSVKVHWIFGLYYTNADHTVPWASEEAKQKSLYDKKLLINGCSDGIKYYDSILYFVLNENDILRYILQQVSVQKPDLTQFKCIVECNAKFSEEDKIICTIKMIRMDKRNPNNRYTIEQTLLNIKESLSFECVCSLLLKSHPN